MFIALLTLITLSIAITAAVFSVSGLMSIFAGTAFKVMVMGSVLEAGKLAAVSFLYRYWKQTPWMLKTMLFSLVPILVLITSMGIFGVLSQGYQTQGSGVQQTGSRIELLKVEQARLQKRKEQIDGQIAALPSNSVRGRARLTATYSSETKTINTRLPEIDKELLELSTKTSEVEAHVGPIIFIAKAFGMTTDDAIKWLAILLVIVMDPIAIGLTLAVNIAIREKQREDAEKVHQPPMPAPIIASPQQTPEYIPDGQPSEVKEQIQQPEQIAQPDVIQTPEPILNLIVPEDAQQQASDADVPQDEIAQEPAQAADQQLRELMATTNNEGNTQIPELVRRLQRARNFIDNLSAPTLNQLKTKEKIKKILKTVIN